MPLGELEEEGWHKILIIGAESLFIDRVKELLPEDDDFKYELANSGFEAGIQAESFHPDTIVIDLAMGRSEGLQIAQNLRRNPQYEQTMIIALASEDEAAPADPRSRRYEPGFETARALDVHVCVGPSQRREHGARVLRDGLVVLDRLSRGSGVVTAGLSPAYQARLRSSLPALHHRTLHEC